MKKLFLISVINLIFFTVASANDPSQISHEVGLWSPYLTGALIGVLLCLTFYFSNKPIGASSFYATLAGFIGSFIALKHTKMLRYFKENPPEVNWEFVFVCATVLGGAIGALSGGEFAIRGLPELWTNSYGENSGFKYAALSILGGSLMAFGARLTGGCTSGHGISGTSQLSLASWISLICFFIGGVIAIQFIY